MTSMPNGILNVSAKDKGTGKEQKITITGSSGLSDSEIVNMVDDAESTADEDQHKKELIEARNRADTLVYSTEKLLNENRDKIERADVSAVEEAIAETREAMEGDDVGRINSATEALTQVSPQVGRGHVPGPGRSNRTLSGCGIAGCRGVQGRGRRRHRC